MRALWIVCVLVGLSFHCCLGKKTPKFERRNTKQLQGAHNDPTISRLKEELAALNSVAIDYIVEKKFGERLQDINIADVISTLIETNATGLLKSFSASCPRFAGSDGIYTIKLSDLEQFEVLCNAQIAGAGWLVIHQRIDGQLNFFRNWTEHQLGFGDLAGEFSMGLDHVHAITASQPHALYVHLEDFEGQTRYASYDEFEIGSEAESYALKKLGTFSGNAGDALAYSRNTRFTTYDRDNDESSDNCAISHMGGWWYKNCMHSNLNGLYLHGNYEYASKLTTKGIYWYQWRSTAYSYRLVRMMIRPINKCL